MPIPKKHHYVPQMLLRRFADADGKLWYFDKRIPGKTVRSATPDKIFYQKHLYSILERDGTKNTSLESAFSRIEGASNAIIQKICVAARVGKPPQLTHIERCSWDQYFYYQWKRTPDSLAKFTDEDDAEARIVELVDEFEGTVRPLTDRERMEILSMDGLKRIIQRARVQAVADPGQMVLDALANCSLAIAVPDNEKKSFIIGSNPVVKFTTDQETRIGKADVEVWLPIASDVAVCMVRGTDSEILKPIPNEFVRQLNLSSFSHSTVIAGRSEALISSLVDDR